MLGYYKDEEQTKQNIDEDGFFHTGDIGILDEDGFLIITDRKKEMFKTSGGKYIAPQNIENIIQPNFSFLREWAKRHNIQVDKTNEDLVENKMIRERLGKEVDKINKKLGKWEQIKVYDFTPDEWSIEAGHLTPTLKLKRRIIIEKYRHMYNKFYNKE